MVFGAIGSAIGSAFLDFGSAAGDFLASEGGQAALSTAGQVFKIKELGWVPGASGPAVGNAPQSRPSQITFGENDPSRSYVDVTGQIVQRGGGGPGGGLISANGAVAGGAGPQTFTNPFGSSFVELKGKQLLDRWRRASEMPVQGVDVISMGQEDDRETAKLAIKHGVIPADSDLGQMLQMAGATVTIRGVKMSDGTTIRMRVVTVKGAKTRKRRNYNTVAGRRNAARTLTQMGQQLRTYKRLASLGAKVHNTMNPKRAKAACCPPKRKKVC